jgi:hypothetical protein
MVFILVSNCWLDGYVDHDHPDVMRVNEWEWVIVQWLKKMDMMWQRH